MKALSIRQPFAAWVAAGTKTIELRSVRTDYRGDFIVCASQGPYLLPAYTKAARIRGFGLGVVELYACRPFETEDLERARITARQMRELDIDPGRTWSWLVRKARPHPWMLNGTPEPPSARGMPGLFDPPRDLVRAFTKPARRKDVTGTEARG